VGNTHAVERPIEIGRPIIQKIDELRKFRRHVVVLPDVALQQPRVVWQAIEDFCGGEGESLKLAQVPMQLTQMLSGASRLLPAAEPPTRDVPSLARGMFSGPSHLGLRSFRKRQCLAAGLRRPSRGAIVFGRNTRAFVLEGSSSDNP
jgi:hypothetical protein